MKLIQIKKIEKVNYTGKVYDLEVEKNHSYNINGIIVHNSACSTSDATGFNRGQITEIIECSEYADILNINIVADGGIKHSGYAAKAFAAGANYVMMGGYFSKAIEAHTHQKGDGTYWGGASKKQQEMYGTGLTKHSEGKVKEIKEKPIPLKDLTEELWGQLASSISYSGYKNLNEFIGNGIFEIKQNSLPPKHR